MIDRRKFVSDAWKWTGLLFVPTILRAQFLPNRRKVFRPASGPAVAFDAKFEKGSLTTSSPFSFVSNAGTTSGSVGSNSNRLLLAYASFRNTNPTAVAMTWNSVSMTQIGSVVAGGSADNYLFGLIAPATGAQTLSCSWTGGTVTICVGAASLYNVNQTTAWQNNGSDTGTSTSPSATITSAIDNMAVAFHVNNNATSTTINQGTSDWVDETLDGNYAGAHRLSTSGSTIISWTLGNSQSWAILKTDVVKA